MEYWSVGILSLLLAFAVGQEKEMKDNDKNVKILFDFTSPSDVSWNSVNDVVMGGVSRSRFQLQEDSTALFSGNVSLENNGGFASVRTSPHSFELEGYKGIQIRVKGDGQRYSFRIRTDSRFDGIAYKSDFDTEKDEWTEIALPFSSFVPTFRGRILKNMPPLEPGNIRQIGFMISDKQRGTFYLQIDWIKAF